MKDKLHQTQPKISRNKKTTVGMLFKKSKNIGTEISAAAMFLQK